MIEKLRMAYSATIQMLKDGIGKIADEYWRQGTIEYLVPVRLAYHIIAGLEWLVTILPPEEHRKTRRYGLDWQGPVDKMPSRQEMLQDVEWIAERIDEWFDQWVQDANDETRNQDRLGRAIHFLRHTQHHLGEFGAAARLLGQERAKWK